MLRPNAKKNTSSNKLEPIKFVGGSKYMKELQRTVFFAAYESIVATGNSITDKQQKELLYQSILGSGRPDHISLPEQMVLGMNQFSCLYDDVGTGVNDDRNASSAGEHHELDKKLKDCFLPQKSNGGKLAIYANKADGITKELLRAKTLSNPIDVSLTTIMRGAKEVLKNGRKALACAKDSESEYKNGTLPSGRTLADYHKFIRQSMFVKLNGRSDDNKSSSGKGEDDTDNISDNEKEEDVVDHHGERFVDADDMPEDYFFSGMIAFFLWGFIVDENSLDQYRSKQFQINDSSPDQKGSNSRRQVRKDAASIASIQRDTGAAAGSPFKRGTTMSQQIEIAKLQVITTIEERKSLDQEFTTAMQTLQQDIDNRMELAKLWQVSNRSDPLFEEIRELMAQKNELTRAFKEDQIKLNTKRQLTDEMMEQAFVPLSRRFKSSASTTGDMPTSVCLSDSNATSLTEDECLTSPEDAGGGRGRNCNL